MIIRDVKAEDNEKLLDIEKKSAQEGKIWFTSHRADFFEKSRFFREGFFLVAEDEKTGDLIGCAGAGYAYYSLKGERVKGVYLYGLRTNPKCRMKVARWLKAVIEKMTETLRSSDGVFAYGSVKKDNDRSAKISQHIGLFPERVFNIYAVPVIHKPRVKGTIIDYAPNIKEVDSIYQQAAEGGDLVPLDLAETFLPTVLEQGRIRIMRYGSARALVWDTSGQTDFSIARLNGGLKWLQILFKGISASIPVIKVPSIGHPIKSWQVMELSYKTRKDGLKLVRAVHNAAWREKIHLLMFGEDSEDNLVRAILGTLAFSLPFQIVTIDRDNTPLNLNRIPLWPPTM